MENCIFCRIVQKEIPSAVLHEDEETLAFKDINPQAPLHAVIVPKRHIEKVSEMTEETIAILGKLVLVGNRLARKEGFSERGYRFVINCNRDGGQTVYHLHLHLLAGRPFRWPPG